MDVKQSDKLLFIVANPGAGGHRLGRIISCLDNVYWYSHVNNGINPWDASNNDIVAGKNISKYHYDRLINDTMVPLVGHRIERYWDSADFDHYYRLWTSGMELSGANDIINSGQYISWVLHDQPDVLRNRFPNCKIIHLKDPENVLDRFMQTTALFPIHIRNIQYKPSYHSFFGADIEHLLKYNSNPSHRDYWAWTIHGEPFYSIVYDKEYRDYIDLRLKGNGQMDIPGVLNTSWDILDIESIKSYLQSNSIDDNFKSLVL